MKELVGMSIDVGADKLDISLDVIATSEFPDSTAFGNY